VWDTGHEGSYASESEYRKPLEIDFEPPADDSSKDPAASASHGGEEEVMAWGPPIILGPAYLFEEARHYEQTYQKAKQPPPSLVVSEEKVRS
jgi:hypothetical protein